MEGSVPQYVELFPGPQPGRHCRLLSLTQQTVRVSTTEDLHGGVGHDLEPPEPSHRELGVEIPHLGQRPGVAQVNMVVVAVESAQLGPAVTSVVSG